MGPGPHHQPSPGTCVLPMFFQQQSGKNLANSPKSMKISLVPRCSPARPASREQPSVSTPLHKDSAGRRSRRRPTAPRAAQIPEIGNPQPAANGANGEKPATPSSRANGRKPHPHLNEANGEIPESATAPRGGPGGSPPRTSTADHREAGHRPANSTSCLV